MRHVIDVRRYEKKITQKELSAFLGVSVNTYKSWLKGTPIPSDKLILLSEALDSSIDYLLEIKTA